MPPAAPIETAATLPPDGRDTPPPASPHNPRAARKRKPEPRRGQLLVLPSARTGEGRRLREFRAGLIEHVGKPSLVQLALIDRATVLQHHLTTFDRKAAADGGLSDHTTRVYLAWQNTLTRTLAQLGLKAAPAEPPPRWVPYAARGTALAASGQPPALPASTRAERQALAARDATPPEAHA